MIKEKIGFKDVSSEMDIAFMRICIAEQFGNYCLSNFIYKIEDETRNNFKIIIGIKENSFQYIGFIKMNLHKEKEESFLHIPCLLIKKEFQKQGLGKRIIDFIKNDLRLDSIKLESYEDSIGFWRKQGFKTERKTDDLNEMIYVL